MLRFKLPLAHGYGLVELSGENTDDKGITIMWKERLMIGIAVEYYSTATVID